MAKRGFRMAFGGYEVFAKLFDPIIERHRAHRQPAAPEKLPSAASAAAVSVQDRASSSREDAKVVDLCFRY